MVNTAAYTEAFAGHTERHTRSNFHSEGTTGADAAKEKSALEENS